MPNRLSLPVMPWLGRNQAPVAGDVRRISLAMTQSKGSGTPVVDRSRICGHPRLGRGLPPGKAASA